MGRGWDGLAPFKTMVGCEERGYLFWYPSRKSDYDLDLFSSYQNPDPFIILIFEGYLVKNRKTIEQTRPSNFKPGKREKKLRRNPLVLEIRTDSFLWEFRSMKGLFKSKPRTPPELVRLTREHLINVDLNTSISDAKREEKVFNYWQFLEIYSYFFFNLSVYCIWSISVGNFAVII